MTNKIENKNIEMDSLVKISFENGQNEIMEGYAGSSNGIRYDVFVVVGSVKQFMGLLYHADRGVFCGHLKFFFTRYNSNGDKMDSMGLEAVNFEEAGSGILKAIFKGLI